ncbi:MAG: DUF3010 family protein [Proteobacteria bacterium]|nr:DUF3010 family protein [Pseudomonadota bacterium]
MAVAGIFLKGNFANIVTLEGTQGSHKFVDEDFNKVEIGKNPTQKDVVTLVETIKKYIEKNQISEIVLNRRVTAGQMAGAAGTFLWEGILLTMSTVPLRFVHVATIRATDKKVGDLKTQKPEENVPLEKAYDFAFEGLK